MWDGAARRLSYICAGHPPPLVRRVRDAAAEPLDSGLDIPIQVLREYRYGERTVAFAPGDLLALYTDGITEALSSRR